MNNYTILDLSVWELPVQEELLVLRRKVNRLPIDEVLSRYGVKMERRRGDMIDALCPFHLDHHLGSFKINVTKNSCFCFACQNGGGVVKSVSKILEKDETETILQIAMAGIPIILQADEKKNLFQQPKEETTCQQQNSSALTDRK